ncbi:MAG: hypothetical protein MI919_32690, partial [Holophagales bacterium]|nr:hypothetical protein [Holophagales bacterium]
RAAGSSIFHPEGYSHVIGPLVEILAHDDLASQRPGLAWLGHSLEGYELGDRPAGLPDDDFFALQDALDQRRELGFGLRDIGDRHE